MKSIKDDSVKLMRHLLGSIDLSDIEDKKFRKDMSTSDRDAYCAAIFAVWPRLEKDLKEFMYDQLMFASLNTESFEQLLVARGTFNGFDLLFDFWRTAASEYEAKPKEDLGQPEDINNPIGQI